MWQTNERFLDRYGCGDEFFLDADLKASWVLAALNDIDRIDDIDDTDEPTAD